MMFKRKSTLQVSFLILLLMAGSLAFAFQPYLRNRFLSPPFGEYTFDVADNEGNKIAQGKIIVTVFAHNAMQGRWQLHFFKNNHPSFAHRSNETSASAFAGEVRGNEVKIHLNLNMADANDVLEGELENSAMRGEFLFCGFAGCAAIGKFEAVRK
ncbi:MAG: hypothetical protein HYR56_00375 [Acidobacteria bacterium]|nr:hypothetical protein [Acidobacteriota bacterium]